MDVEVRTGRSEVESASHSMPLASGTRLAPRATPMGFVSPVGVAGARTGVTGESCRFEQFGPLHGVRGASVGLASSAGADGIAWCEEGWPAMVT